MKLPDVKKVYNGLKASAKKRGIPFELSLTDLYDLDYPITCPILGIPLRFNVGQVKDNSYSVDRIDNSKGYSIDNIQVISYKANILKNNATIEELKLFSKYFA